MNSDAYANWIYWHAISVEDRDDARQVQALAGVLGKSRSFAVMHWYKLGKSIDSRKRESGRIALPVDEGDEWEDPPWMGVPDRTRQVVDFLDRLESLCAIASEFQLLVLSMLLQEMTRLEIVQEIGWSEGTVHRAIAALREGKTWEPTCVA